MAISGPSSRNRRTTSMQKRRLLNFELLDQRRVLASITGQVFGDLDQSFRVNDAEVGLENRVVYIDLNDNSEVDLHEPLQLTGADGRFVFDDLPAGDYVVRLFNGTVSQHQNFPFLPESFGEEILTPDAFSAGTSPLAGLSGANLVGTGLPGGEDLRGFTASGNKLTEVALDTASSRSTEFGSDIVGFLPLGDGQVLAWMSESAAGDTPIAAIVQMNGDQVTELEIDLPASTPTIDTLALASEGRGFFVPAFDGDASVPLYSFVLDTESGSWQTKPLSINVSASAQLFANPAGPLVLVAQQTEQGTQVALVSSVTESVVTDKLLDQVLEFLDFDDASNLAVARDLTGQILVMDTANGFEVLQTITNWNGPVVLDGHRELLFGLSRDGVQIFDIVEGNVLASLAMATDLSTAAALALTDGGDRLMIRRPSGVSQVRIDQIAAHRVSFPTDGLQTTDELTKDILFGMVIDGENLAPAFTEAPEFNVLEDQTLFTSAPGLSAGVPNPELDQYLTLQLTDPSHGTAVVSPNGTMTYRPNPDFFGSDSFDIQVTDGRDITETVTVQINVLPVDDGPRGLLIDVPPIPEGIIPPSIIGTIQIDEVDGDTYIVTIDDPRFEMEGDDLILVGGVDHELEPVITIIITVTNPENEEDTDSFTATLTVEDEDDAPTDILPNSAEVEENVPGAEIVELTIVDQDESDDYTLVVSDPRFVVVGRLLRLADQIALDHETEPTISLTITALSAEGETLLVRGLELTVSDSNDNVTDITLSGTSVPELASGYTVGVVGVVDQDSGDEHTLSVNDERFEIVNRNLKLRDGVYVRRSDQAEIQLTITARDLLDSTRSFSKDFVLNVLSNEQPWHNVVEPTDVDGDGDTSPIDVLIIINSLNNLGPRALIDPIPYEDGEPRFFDVNGDGKLTPIDALIIVNLLNRGGSGSAESGGGDGATSGEGESQSSPIQPLIPTPVPIIVSPFDDDDDDDLR